MSVVPAPPPPHTPTIFRGYLGRQDQTITNADGRLPHQDLLLELQIILCELALPGALGQEALLGELPLLEALRFAMGGAVGCGEVLGPRVWD